MTIPEDRLAAIEYRLAKIEEGVEFLVENEKKLDKDRSEIQAAIQKSGMGGIFSEIASQ